MRQINELVRVQGYYMMGGIRCKTSKRLYVYQDKKGRRYIYKNYQWQDITDNKEIMKTLEKGLRPDLPDYKAPNEGR